MSLQSTDPIADLLTRIRNAALVGKTEIRVPTSKLKKVVAEQLVKNHYLAGVKVEDGKPRGTLVVKLAKDGENCPITEITRVSKPGRRVYTAASDIPKVKQGRGIVLVSTSKGVMTGTEAAKAKPGGEPQRAALPPPAGPPPPPGRWQWSFGIPSAVVVLVDGGAPQEGASSTHQTTSSADRVRFTFSAHAKDKP